MRSRDLMLMLATVAATPVAVQAQDAWHRPDVSGRNGAVVAGHPLAAAAGHEVLRSGGNAVDAAVTMAAVLAVVRPHMNGVGGDAFALIHDAASGRIVALNGSGRAGALATPAFFEARGMDEIPGRGAASVTVPGAVSAWAAALERYGTITLAEALAPAIALAADGWVVSSTLERDIAGAIDRLNPDGQALFAPDGALPPVGDVLRNAALARSLLAIARDGPDAFYQGGIARRLASFIEAEGGYLRFEDFQAHRADWTEPVALRLDDGRTAHTAPPNSQGFVLLPQLAMAEQVRVADRAHNSADYLHALIEIKKLAFADRDRWLADPAVAPPPLERLLEPEYLRRRAGRITDSAADSVTAGFDAIAAAEPADGDGDTVYLMAVDRHGNAVSWIQSLFSSFGSGLVEPRTGIVLHNRGAGFVLDPRHPNAIAPGKRPFHTLMPVMITDADGRLRLTLGTPGGHGQSQFLTQTYQNVFHFGMTPQQAVEAPRFLHDGGLRLRIENRVGDEVVLELGRRGHDVRTAEGWTAVFGGVQMILIDPATGVLRTGADPRREAYGIAY